MSGNPETEQETITVSKDSFEKLISRLEIALDKVEKLEQDLEAERSRQPAQTQMPRIPQFHSIQNVQMNKIAREEIERERVEQSLEKAVDYALADYNKNPPINKR